MNRSGTHARSGAGRMEHRGRLIGLRRNRYFTGKPMDAHQFELETAYGINARRMLNRMVLGDGVVCGLDVTPGAAVCSIQVSAGLAIDAWGREIVVPETTEPVSLPPWLIDRLCDSGNGGGEPPTGSETDTSGERPAPEENGDRPEENGEKPSENGEEPGTACVTVVLCYDECESDPVQVLAGDCGTGSPCAPGSIREQYRISFEEGCLDPYDMTCQFPELPRNRRLDYADLARYVTRGCPDPPQNPCVPLANLRLKCGNGRCDIDPATIDITIRPVVFANPVLFDLLSCMVEREQSGESEPR